MMGEQLQVGALIVAMVGGGGVVGVALKLAYDNAKNAGGTHDKAFDKGFAARNSEVDGLRSSFEARFDAMETELAQLRKVLVKFLGWVKEEHRQEAFELLIELGLPPGGHKEGQ